MWTLRRVLLLFLLDRSSQSLAQHHFLLLCKEIEIWCKLFEIWCKSNENWSKSIENWSKSIENWSKVKVWQNIISFCFVNNGKQCNSRKYILNIFNCPLCFCFVFAIVHCNDRHFLTIWFISNNFWRSFLMSKVSQILIYNLNFQFVSLISL